MQPHGLFQIGEMTIVLEVWGSIERRLCMICCSIVNLDWNLMSKMSYTPLCNGKEIQGHAYNLMRKMLMLIAAQSVLYLHAMLFQHDHANFPRKLFISITHPSTVMLIDSKTYVVLEPKIRTHLSTTMLTSALLFNFH